MIKYQFVQCVCLLGNQLIITQETTKNNKIGQKTIDLKNIIIHYEKVLRLTNTSIYDCENCHNVSSV